MLDHAIVTEPFLTLEFRHSCAYRFPMASSHHVSRALEAATDAERSGTTVRAREYKRPSYFLSLARIKVCEYPGRTCANLA